MHIDVSVAREHVNARLEAAVAAGGRIVDESHAPSHWTLADPAGNRVCICAWPERFCTDILGGCCLIGPTARSFYSSDTISANSMSSLFVESSQMGYLAIKTISFDERPLESICRTKMSKLPIEVPRWPPHGTGLYPVRRTCSSIYQALLTRSPLHSLATSGTSLAQCSG